MDKFLRAARMSSAGNSDCKFDDGDYICFIIKRDDIKVTLYFPYQSPTNENVVPILYSNLWNVNGNRKLDIDMFAGYSEYDPVLLRIDDGKMKLTFVPLQEGIERNRVLYLDTNMKLYLDTKCFIELKKVGRAYGISMPLSYERVLEILETADGTNSLYVSLLNGRLIDFIWE